MKYNRGGWPLKWGGRLLGSVQAFWAQDVFPTPYMAASCQVNCSTGSCPTEPDKQNAITLGTVPSARTENWKMESLVALWMGSLSVSDTNVAFTGVTLKDEPPIISVRSYTVIRKPQAWIPFLSCCQRNHCLQSPSNKIHPGKCQSQGKDWQSYCQPVHSLIWALFSRGKLNISPSHEWHKVVANYAKFVIGCFADVSWQQHTLIAQDHFPAVNHGKPTELPMVQIPWPKRHSSLWHRSEILWKVLHGILDHRRPALLHWHHCSHYHLLLPLLRTQSEPRKSLEEGDLSSSWSSGWTTKTPMC